jgi:pimeloyl-ACP methyl ester carboxylesterase
MKPVAFGGCFGWLHEPQGPLAGDLAFLVCQSLMKEAMTAYVSVRTLADSVAALGIPALRFDYPGTGDSLDLGPTDLNENLHSWQRSIDDSIDWLRRTTGARRIVLCGFRAGAAFAAHAATQHADVAGLILIEPVIAGRAYVRQLDLEGQLLHHRQRAPGEDLLLHELRLSQETLDDIGALDLRTSPPPVASKIALFARSDSRALLELVDGWRSAHLDVSRPAWTGLDPLFADKLIDEAPLADFTVLLDWLKKEIPNQPAPARTIALEPARLHPPGAVEEPLFFGRDHKSFGILARPESGATDQVVIVGNVGHDPHYGPGRQSATLARRLAAAGVACLRIDFAGLGDSPGQPGKENVRAHVFATDRSPELESAVDALQARGFRRFALQGTCSAAYHAFHGALADPRVSSLMMVNIPLFTLPNVDTLGHLEQRWQSPWHYALKVFNRSSWVHLLRGDRDLGLALRTQFLHAPARLLRRLGSLARRLGLLPNRSFAWNSMAALSKRGVRTLFVFSDGNAEREAFAHEFGQAGEQLATFGRTEMKIVPGMDHGLMKARERSVAEALITEFAITGKG